jgi:hypothetical protein
MRWRAHSAGVLPVALVALVAAGFGLAYVPGDAQVHLAVAESFAQGHPFQYNAADGERVVASTSPFWTLMLGLLFRLSGHHAVLGLKVAVLLAWAGVGALTWRWSRRNWGFSPPAASVAALVWFGTCAIAINGLGGLENVLGALQLLLLGWVLSPAPAASGKRTLWIGLLTGWAFLTRLDIGLFAGVLVAGDGARRVAANGRPAGAVRGEGRRAVAAAAIALAVLVPWYAYQWAVTGALITDSSVARAYAGRSHSIVLWPGWLYLHPKTLLTLGVVFLPLSVGFGATVLGMRRLPPEGRAGPTMAAWVVGASVVFYTFVVGATHFGRYFLPAFPFFIVGGVAGLSRLADRGSTRAPWLGHAVVVLAAAYLALTNAVDWRRRLVRHDQYAMNWRTVWQAPLKRRESTDALLTRLGAGTNASVRYALTEVQARYYLDSRVTVLSLDGRTSSQVLRFTDPVTGLPDFGPYLEAVRPDVVDVAQWSPGSDSTWLPRLRTPFQTTPNLMAEWYARVGGMRDGEAFDWGGRRVVRIARHLVRLEWPAIPSPRRTGGVLER